MEINVQHTTTTIELIKNEIQSFLQHHQNQNQTQGAKRRNSSCVESSSFSEGTLLAQKLMEILENEEEARARAAQSPEKKVMSNSLVVREILSNVDVHSLLNFRQVSRLWREEATSLLLSGRHQSRNEEFLSVKFKHLARDGNYCHDNGETLEDFLEESSQNSQMLIYSGFIFEGGFFQGDPTLDRLFSDFGPRIRYLNLSLKHLHVTQLRQILKELTPNLKSLILDPENLLGRSNPNPNPPNPEEDSRLFLPQLRKISLPKRGSSSVDLILEILTCAPNLTSIEDPNLAYVTQIISAGKLGLVKSLTWSFECSADQVANLLRFVAAGPKLTSLTLRDFNRLRDSHSRPDERIFPAILNLLELGQTSLEKVTGVEILGQHFGVRTSRDLLFPSLPNLTELQVSAEKIVLVPADQILPRGHDLSRIVPNLKLLHLKADKSEIYPFTSPLNAHAALQKLKVSISTFKLTSQHVRQWVEKLGGLYPNITHLDISIRYKGEENIPECLKLIPRHFKNLKQLVLQIWIAKNSYDQLKSEWNLDAALTGLSKEECNRLKKKKDGPDPEFQKLEILDQNRTAPSILDLKKLTNLTFEVQFKGKVQPLWSHVAQLYAFEPMGKRQGLEVKVCGFYTNRIPLTGNDLGPL